MELYLIRHPLPDVEPGVCYGQLDVGIAEPTAPIGERLRPMLPEHYELYASPLSRARLLAEEFGPPRLDERLKEISFGEWEGKPFGSLGELLSLWADDPLGFKAPDGESVREMAARVHHWMDEVLTPSQASAIVVVAHGGPLRAIAGRLLGVPAKRWLGLDFACGALTRLDITEWGALLKWFNR